MIRRLRPDALVGAAGGGLAVLVGGAAGLLQDAPELAIGVTVVGAAAVGWAVYRQVSAPTPAAAPREPAPRPDVPERILGADDRLTLAAANNLALTLTWLGDLDTARPR